MRRLLGTARLVTLTGPGGVGKTRLATRVARDAERAFADGVVFVELAQLRDGALVANLVADRLGLHDLSGLPAARQVIEHLRDRSLLLVLDNCEHLIDACAEFAAAVLDGCPRVVLLATSRQSLTVAGEHVQPVPPLPIADAVHLFKDRATAIWSGALDGQDVETTLTELCRRLDGLPLAIELAAARIRALSPAQILDRLTTRFTLLTSGRRAAPRRQQTLRDTIDWSFELCSEAEQAVWARTSVFAGSFDLEAATHVCADAALGTDTVLDLVDGLVDKSVLIRDQHDDPAHYRMLESLREYGQEHLARSGDRERVARLHSGWFDQLAVRADLEWAGDRQRYWIDRLRRDHANLRAALGWSLSEPGEEGAALRIAARPFEYWMVRGLAGEARTWLTRTLAATPPDHPDRGRALCACAVYTIWQGGLDRTEPLLAEIGAVAEANADEVLRAKVPYLRSFAALLSVVDEAVEPAEEAAAVFRAHGLVRDELHPLFIHGVAVAHRDREPTAARRSLRRMHDLAVDHGGAFYQAMALFGRAIVEVEHGEVAAADDAATAALRLDLDIGDQHGMAYRADTLAWVADRRGEHERAATLFGVAETVWARIGTTADFAVARPHRKHITNTRAELGETRFDRAFAIGRALPTGEAMRYALGEPSSAPPETAETPPALTAREAEVAALVAEGLTNRDIAAKLVISRRTVDTHVGHILGKLELGNRAQIASWVAGRTRE
ncbi:hypothetical protein HUW46_01306 [Amycolatopsis sp. CA-230715]|nr:hypothetical protein HUW46_01306 [Amycolatopsis sp. CA-230715]